MRGMGGRRRGGGGVPFYLIFMAMQYTPRLLEVKPLVTCSLGGALLAIHFRVLGPLPLLYAADIREVCLMPGAILYDVELLRFVTGVVTYFSDYHLYYTLGSLAAKGLALEPRIGSSNFAVLLLAVTVLTAIVTVVLSFSLYNVAGDHGWMKECYCGLSPALFALKPVSLALGGPERTSFFGFTMPSAHAVWFELLLLLVINRSPAFVFAHLCGILAGYLWILIQDIGDFERAVPEFAHSLLRRLTRPAPRGGGGGYGDDGGGSAAAPAGAAAGWSSPGGGGGAIAGGAAGTGGGGGGGGMEEQGQQEYAQVDAEELRRRRMARFS